MITILLSEMWNSENYIYAERYINFFKKVANEVSVKFCAINGESSFTLPYYHLEKTKAKIYLASPAIEIYDKILSSNQIKMYIHPDMINEPQSFNTSLADLVYETNVVPTSSTRTVIPKGENYAIKLHLDRRLSRYIRRLTEGSIEHSILISSELETSLKDAPETFGFLAESIGISYNGKGMIIRELAAKPYFSDTFYVPLFSLYSPDIKDKNHVPFFSQMVQMKNKKPLDCLIEDMIRPLFVNMNHYIQKYGLLLECHGQNVLAEFDRNYDIKRLIHRDFQSMYVDKDIRDSQNLTTPFKKHVMGEECSKEISYSLVYDQYVGSYLLDNFTKLLNERYNVAVSRTTHAIQHLFQEIFDKNLFPRGGFYTMSKQTFKDNNTEFVWHSSPPRYR